MIRYRVMLTETEVAELSLIISKGAHTFRNAYLLLNGDEGPYGQKVGKGQLAKMLRVNSRSIERVKKRFCAGGLGSSTRTQALQPHLQPQSGG